MNEIEKIEKADNISYAEKQKLAIKTAVNKGILILTGGPGTGKTTTLKGILRLFQSEGLDISLAAPTGRAAKRMTELTGKEAKTIHRLLEVEWDEHDRPTFKRNIRNPLECEALILDDLGGAVDQAVYDPAVEPGADAGQPKGETHDGSVVQFIEEPLAHEETVCAG